MRILLGRVTKCMVMPNPSIISFDAAGTLIDVQWNPGLTAVQAALQAGTAIDTDRAGSFDLLLRKSWLDYLALNLTRDEGRLDDFWRTVGRQWYASMGIPYTVAFEAEFWELLYGRDQKIFSLFDDALPALTGLAASGHRLAVLSNWDYSLHRILRMLGILDRFEVVIASLEEGPEKPDSALFSILCERLSATPSDVVHVGDHAIDDYQGARRAGMRGILIDRGQQDCKPPFIASLTDLPHVL